MQIRIARPAEFEELGELTVAAFEGIAGSGDLGEYADTLRDVADRAARAVVLAAVDDATLLGGVTYVPDPANPYAEDLRLGEAGIRMLAVAPAAQGRGVGRALTEACVARARAQGAARVSLHSTPWMTVAHQLYESMGFVRTPERDVDVRSDLRLMAFVLELSAAPGTTLG